jgi:hypothetical protein
MSPGPTDIDVYVGVEPPYLTITELVFRGAAARKSAFWQESFRAGFRGEIRSYMQRYQNSGVEPIPLRVSIDITGVEGPPPPKKGLEDAWSAVQAELLIRIVVPVATLTLVPSYFDRDARYQMWFRDVSDKSGTPSQIIEQDFHEEIMLSLWPQGLLLSNSESSFSRHPFGGKGGPGAEPMMKGQTCARALMREFALWQARKQRRAPEDVRGR